MLEVLPELNDEGPGEPRILDFDLETIAAGFADPAWVPQKITCAAWSWCDEVRVDSAVCGVEGLFHAPARRAKMLSELITAMNKADVLTGHNIIRFDLPIIASERFRLVARGFQVPALQAYRVQDTMRLRKTKGFKKGLDSIAGLVQTPIVKQSMDWQQWEDAYEEVGWPKVRSRCVSDVAMHKQARLELIRLGALRPITTWRP